LDNRIIASIQTRSTIRGLVVAANSWGHEADNDRSRPGPVDLSQTGTLSSGEGSHKSHHHFIDGLIGGVDGNKVRLSANAMSR
jgi:hypothetical protein